MKAICKETGREIDVDLITIYPGETSPCALPNKGFSATEFLNLTLKGEMEYQVSNINRTPYIITIYKGVYEGGYFWNEHLVFKKEEE